MMHHSEAQEWERNWWGTCQNTYGEEMKQLLYAKKMGLKTFHDGKSPFNFDMAGKAVMDIGGGPVSLLLKCQNLANGVLVDPCDFPEWIYVRYKLAGIEVRRIRAEDIPLAETEKFDEVWIYNVLQHSEFPDKVIRNSRRVAKLLRIFEWLDTDITLGHPHAFSESQLNIWLGGEGKVEQLNGEATCVGKCYYGIFKGDWYEEV